MAKGKPWLFKNIVNLLVIPLPPTSEYYETKDITNKTNLSFGNLSKSFLYL